MGEYSRVIKADIQSSDNQIVVLDLIGRGRMFCVYKARRGTKYITLKVANVADAMHNEMLRREYELCHTLSHPSIVRTYSFEEDTPLGVAILQEYIEGVTLDKYLEQSISKAQKRSLLRDILSGVDYLHHRGVLHNDLKPENIIVNTNGSARIIDFGLSLSDDSIYRGCVGGSSGFTAPEILEHGTPSAASDIYSLGRIVEVIFGSKAYKSIIHKCAESEPSQRYQTINSLSRAIIRHDRLPLVVAMSVLLLMVVGAVAYPVVREGIEESRYQRQLEVAESEMDVMFREAVSEMQAQKYREFTSRAKGEYYMRYLEYVEQVPESARHAVEVVFAEQVATLDSIMLSLPSIESLPQEEKLLMIDILNSGEY